MSEKNGNTVVGETDFIDVDKIKLNPDWPYRKQLGHLTGLCKSLEKPSGLIQPIGVDTSGFLVWGRRRLAAAKELGWKKILCRIVDLDDPLSAMREENEGRLNLATSELTAMMRAIEAQEKKKAKQRQKDAGGKSAGGNVSTTAPEDESAGGNIPTSAEEKGRSRDKAAEVFGISGKTFDSMKKIDEKGTTALKEILDERLISIADAVAVVDSPPEVQEKAVAAVREGKAKTVSAVLRKKKKPRRKTEKKPPQKPPKKDQLGTPLPDSCRDAFADPQLPELIAELRTIDESFAPDPWLAKVSKLVDHYPFILGDKFKKNVLDAQESVQLAKAALEAGIPHAVCPTCHGTGAKDGNGKCCKDCRGCGHVPVWKFAEL